MNEDSHLYTVLKSVACRPSATVVIKNERAINLMYKS